MIARINTGAKPAGAVYYNEYKVAHGEARFLGGFKAIPYERSELSVEKKIDVLEMYAAGNPRIGKPTFHVSLAFHPDEQISDERITEIGQQYMERLGYSHQPYLMYRHEDTHHPHIHIVSISVDADGNRISDSHQQRRSNAIRQALEKEYGLVEAEKQSKDVLMMGLLPEQVLTYKEPGAKKAISNVVRTALTDYHFSNVQTFSEFLHQHRVQMNQIGGVTADGLSYKGITFQLHNGGQDGRGEVIGPTIKASRFAFAPTYDRLQTKFNQNAVRFNSGKEATRQRIHSSLSSYAKLSEADFKGQLRSAGIQVIDTGQQYVYVDHKNRNVYADTELGKAYTRRVQQAAFSEQSAQIGVGSNRVASTSATSGKVAQRPERTERSKSVQAQPQNPEPTAQQLALRRRVSHYYQQVRQQGTGGQAPVFFESHLIRQFPHAHLTTALVGEGVALLDARQAVAQFEAYKQSQLPDIRAKEEAYFAQSASQLVRLSSQLPLSATSKRAFLGSAGYTLSPDSSTVTHREDAHLSYPIPEPVKALLHQDRGPQVAFPDRLTKTERSLYGALASGQTLPDSLSFYQVSAAHLKVVTGPLFATVALSLNKAYVNQVTGYLHRDEPVRTQLQARGIVVDVGENKTYRMGHYLTNPAQFSPVPAGLACLLEREEPLPSISSQTERLHAPAGRRLVQLSQALDMNNLTQLQRLLTPWPGQPNNTFDKDQVVDQARTLQSELINQLKKPVQVKSTGASANGIPLTTQPTTPPAQPPSSLGRGLVDVLMKIDLTPQQRYQVAAQMGFVWQRSALGQWRLKEGEASTHPGRVYSLTTDQQACFNQPAVHEPVRLRLNTSDQALLKALCLGQPFGSLSRHQVANLTLPVVENLLPKENRMDFHCWYNEQRGNQILTHTGIGFGEQASARRYLSALYQRGFLVKQELDTAGKPLYRMGHLKSHPASYAAVPNGITEAFREQFPTQAGKNAYVVEGAWPAPESVAAQRMRGLARAIDGQATPDRVKQQIERIHARFPHLCSVPQAQALLDHLVSQPRRIPKPTNDLYSRQPPPAPLKHLNERVRNSSAERSSYSDSLLALLDRFENQAPQKGLLDILGEAASAIRPKKKRIQEESVPKRAIIRKRH